jgi:hypothetical protein
MEAECAAFRQTEPDAWRVPCVALDMPSGYENGLANSLAPPAPVHDLHIRSWQGWLFVDGQPNFYVNYRTFHTSLFPRTTAQEPDGAAERTDMTDKHIGIAPFLLGAALSIAGCGDSENKVSEVDADCPSPVAEAGLSRSAPLGTQIALSGDESTWCDSFGAHELTFSWGFERVPADSAVADGALSENKTSTSNRPYFLPDIPGEYVVSLRVSDPNGVSDPDYIVITITSDDLRPVADCGPDTYGQVGQATQLDGSGSSDPEGARISYNWGVSSVPPCSRLQSGNIFDQGTQNPSVIPDCQGMFVMSLVVDDGLQWSEPDYCTIDVRSDNRSPVAEAGPGGLVPPCEDNPFQLSGWESYDPDGDRMTYSWSVVSAPPGADPTAYGFVDDTAVAPFFAWDQPGEWTFQLQVSDGNQWSSPDIVTYMVVAEGGNNSPTANAGGDQTVVVEANCSTSSYVWTCEQCPMTTHTMDGTASTDPDGDTLSYGWIETTDTLTWIHDSKAISTVQLPPADAEYDVDLANEYDIQLSVSDCTLSDTDTITLTHICRGIYVLPEVP